MPQFIFTSPDGNTYQVDGPEGATKEQAFQILKQQMLKPAYKDDKGKVETGLPGDHHDDIDKNIPEKQRGYVDLKGNFLDREQASKVAKSMGMDVPDIMHTSDLNKETGIGEDNKPPASERLAKPLTRTERVGTGIKDIGVAGVQDVAHLLPGKVAEHTDKWIQKRERGIEAQEKATGVDGTDWYRTGGQALATLPLAALSPLAAGAASGALTPVTSGDFWKEKAEQTALGAAGGKLAEVGGNALAKIIRPAAVAVADPILAAARKAGYVVHPAETGNAGAVTNAMAGLGGKIKTQQLASVKNQEVTNRLAAEELGLKDGTPLDETAFQQVRKAAGKA